MSKNAVVQELESEQLKSDIPNFKVGDTISIYVRIIEVTKEKGTKANKEGAKERMQVFTGTVIARTGSGLSETVSIHRIAYGEGMERVFLLNSPRIAKIEVVRKGKVRRSKLYYLRGKYGKAAKVKGLIEGRRSKASKAAVVSTQDISENEDILKIEVPEEVVAPGEDQALILEEIVEGDEKSDADNTKE